MSKSEYLKNLCEGREYRYTYVGLIFYHAGIPFEDAKKYMNTLEKKGL